MRRAGTEVRLVTRLVRCDTGDVIWRHVDQVREDRAVSSLPTVTKTIIAEIEAKSQGHLAFQQRADQRLAQIKRELLVGNLSEPANLPGAVREGFEPSVTFRATKL